jgi:hypothetical protein
MLGLCDPLRRRVKDERAVTYYFSKYGADMPTVLSERASDSSLSSCNRRHWRRLACKACWQQSKWMDELNSSSYHHSLTR